MLTNQVKARRNRLAGKVSPLFVQARIVTSEGVEKETVPIENDELRVTVPVRDVLILSVITRTA